jgi:excisionase family DNA binding protein
VRSLLPHSEASSTAHRPWEPGGDQGEATLVSWLRDDAPTTTRESTQPRSKTTWWSATLWPRVPGRGPASSRCRATECSPASPESWYRVRPDARCPWRGGRARRASGGAAWHFIRVDLPKRGKKFCVSVTAPPEANSLLTVQEAGRWLGVARSTLYLLMRKGLPYVQVGRFRRIDVQDLSAYVEAQRVEWDARIRHGGRHAYEIGCRCDACRTAWNDYHRAARERRTAQLDLVRDQVQHGTISTYRNHGCRCPACFQAQSDWNGVRPSRAKPRWSPTTSYRVGSS